MSSPREHFGLILEGTSQAFAFKFLVGLTNYLGFPCEDLNTLFF